jgi:putative flippase GtrA
VRGPKRELISRGYNLLLHTALQARFSDAQCGFKAVRSDVVRELLPLIEDGEWFFDTELLVLAERAGLRIHEVPVDWVDDPDSRVDLADTIKKDLKGVWRLSTALLTGRLPIAALRAAVGRGPLIVGVPEGMPAQALRFGIIGVISTVAFALCFLALQPAFGAQVANLLSLLITAIFNTAANRAFTFEVRGPGGLARHHVQGLAIFGFGLAITSGALFALHQFVPSATREVELVVLVVANLIATITRFIGLRWVFAGASA